MAFELGGHQHMLSDVFNNNLREFLAPKDVAKSRFDPSSCLLIPQGGGSFKDLVTSKNTKIELDFGFKLPLTRPTIDLKI